MEPLLLLFAMFFYAVQSSSDKEPSLCKCTSSHITNFSCTCISDSLVGQEPLFDSDAATLLLLNLESLLESPQANSYINDLSPQGLKVRVNDTPELNINENGCMKSLIFQNYECLVLEDPEPLKTEEVSIEIWERSPEGAAGYGFLNPASYAFPKLRGTQAQGVEGFLILGDHLYDIILRESEAYQSTMHYHAMTFGNNTINVYLDGKLMLSKYAEGPLSFIPQKPGEAVIGNLYLHNTDSPPPNRSKQIAAVRISSKVRTQTEIWKNYVLGCIKVHGQDIRCIN